MNKHKVKRLVLCLMLIGSVCSSAYAQNDYWVPNDIPVTNYKIEGNLDVSGNELYGQEMIRFINPGRRPISIVSFRWSISQRLKITVLQNSKEATLQNKGKGETTKGPLFYLLPEPVGQGQAVELKVRFSLKNLTDESRGEFLLGGWFPKLNWDGHRTADNYQVKFIIPDGYLEAMSGLYNAETSCWELEGAKNFGIYLGKGLQLKETEVEGIKLRVLYPEKGEKVAEVAFETAQKAISFYKEYTGFYPFKFLNIIPGGSGPWGGYPFNPGTVVIHGMEVFEKAKLGHWKWITAHEIGHQYWGEHVLEGDNPDWIWIAMGIHLDREYWHSTGSDYDRHSGLMRSYHYGLKKKFNTTIDISIPAYEAIAWDHNNIIQHGKGFVVISALDWTLGKETFKRVVRRCLKEFAGKRFGYRDLKRVCQEESGEELSWFFDQWVRSDAVLKYEVEKFQNIKKDGGFLTRTVIRKDGDLAMPVPVELEFEDGARVLLRTNRFQDVQELTLWSKNKLVKVTIDPQNLLGIIGELPPRNLKELIRDIKRARGKADALENLELFEEFKRLKLKHNDSLLSLGMLLYGGEYYQEAIEVFSQRLTLSEEKSDQFLNRAWLGLLNDKAGKRNKALEHYQAALACDDGSSMQHSQYGLLINKNWLEKRMKSPMK